MRKQVSVQELRFGMYVAELDRPWTDTPFLFQGFVLSNAQEIEILQRHCKHVFIDPERSEEGADAARQGSTPAQAGSVRGSTSYPEKASLESEIARADYLHARTRKLVEEGLRSLQGNDILDARSLREASSLLSECVVRNPDALVLVNRMREKGRDLVTRALDVSIYMISFGRFLQRSREELELLGLVGLLQDVGKIKLPDALLHKKGPLTQTERELVRGHVLRSVEILRVAAGLPPQVAEVAALHHERVDGSGYPRGLKGGEIGLHGLIAGIVDTFDVLTAGSAYAEPVSPSKALGMLYKARGKTFDAELVEQFIRCIGAFPVGSIVELNSGETGIVLSQNAEQRLKPRIAVIHDARGYRLYPLKILDLAREPKAAPDQPYQIRRTLENDRVQIEPHEIFL